MKISLNISVLATFFMLAGAPVFSQSDSLGMPGDNLDLQAVLSIFKKSSSVEDFEKNLNSASTKINNLDLNSDGQVDYLRVVDYGKDDFHSIVIQDPVSKAESQDVAVIEIVKKGDNTAHIQIVGDETLYGKDYIIEPEDQAPLNSESKKADNSTTDDVYASQNSSSGSTHVMVNVWAWPTVSYIYAPGYNYWVSPWYWGYYPGWYSPWAPYGYYAYHRGFYGYNYGFYGYRRYHHAFPHVHSYYYGRRVSSGYVQKTAPHYGRRVNNNGYNGARSSQGGANRRESGRSNGAVDPNHNNANRGRVQNTQTRQQNTNRGTNAGAPNQRRENAAPRSSGTNNQQRMNQGSQRTNQGSPNVNQGSNRRSQASPGNSAPSGGSRIGNTGGGGGARIGGSGGGRPSGGGGGGGGRSGGGGSGGGGGRR